ncbi:MAG: ABC transporter ATP-binding protein [Maledivibacter sp.]|jgi:spermidine/putrescine transport system ATP-binding protein|nr:ABC transporter ATP-binding protein [Maledivibacter sp.]
MAPNIIQLRNVYKNFGGHKALIDVNFCVRKNEFITLLGPSGCGKTTTLRLIGGFEYPTSGEILFEDNNIADLPPYKRKVNTVFQKYALFPHLNVYDNIAFGLKVKKMDKKLMDKKVKDMLCLVNLNGFEKRSINSLSGGQQQRIAIARALINEPDVLLLDEPLGALDLKLRKGMQTELKRIQQSLGITFIFVTHDQEEALTMSDTIIVMKDGRLQQIGTPEDIYNEPENAFVADFIGESTIVDGIMHEDYLVEFAGCKFKCVDEGFEKKESVDVVIRPEDIKVVAPDEGMLVGMVKSVIFKGVHYEILIKTGNHLFKIHSTKIAPVGKKAGLIIEPDDIHIMKKERVIDEE